MREQTSAQDADRGGVALRARLLRVLTSARLYDLLQLIAGERRLRRRLAPHLASFSTVHTLIDVGGGTGPTRPLPAAAHYVCLDLDPQKLRRFRAKWPGGAAVEADATACPFRDGVVDGVLCTKVVHHLNDAQLEAMLSESARILKVGGVLLLVDAVRSSRWIPRLLWRLDRGAFPRSAGQIKAALPRGYDVTAWEHVRLGLFHDVILCAARRTAGVPGTGSFGEGAVMREAKTTGG